MAEDGDLERLRRGLYRRGADQRALDEYLARRPEDAAPETAPPVPRTRRRPLLLAAAGTVGIAGLVAVAALQSRGGPEPAPSTGPPQRSVSGQVVTPYGATVPLPTPAALSAEGEAAAGQAYRGRGDARFPLDLHPVARSGRIAVAVASPDGEDLDWTASVVDPSRTPAEYRFATGRAAPSAGDPVVVLPWSGAPPSLLEITAPTGARWTAVVALLPAESAAFR